MIAAISYSMEKEI